MVVKSKDVKQGTNSSNNGTLYMYNATLRWDTNVAIRWKKLEKNGMEHSILS